MLKVQSNRANLLKQSISQEGKKDMLSTNPQKTGDNKNDFKDEGQQSKPEPSVAVGDDKNVETSSLHSTDSQTSLVLDTAK